VQISSDILRQCWFLAGPTASGKTAVSIQLAQRIQAEILCLDSMTIYRGMDIGTAKPTLAERSQVPHHLCDIIGPHEEFSVADYLHVAESCCQDILDRGRIPLFVGGTGLYLRSVLRGVFQGPPADWALRQRLEALAQKHGPDWLHTELQVVDPATAARLHPNDARRIIRALEVHQLTGQPLSIHQQQGPADEASRPRHVCWLSPPRDWLNQRIDQRVITMFATGLLAEVRQLQRLSQPMSRTARQALGYKEILDWLEATGNDDAPLPPPDVIAEIQLRTRQFAKRQHTWFRNLEECRAVEMDGTESADELAARIAELG